MGDKQRTQQNLEIVSTDDERGLLFVHGSVPGSKGGWLLIKDAVKVPRHADAPYPASLKSVAGAPEAVVEDVAPADVADVAVADAPVTDSNENTEA
jgi:large subunit ribosomal protein L3